MRASVYITGAAGERVIIDTGPEFRLQALRAGITGLDAVFLTHAHADHLHGLDDIRALTRQHPIPVYAAPLTLAELRERFSYVFTDTQLGGGKPRIDVREAAAPVRIGGLTFTPIPVKHGTLDILGWRISGAGGEGEESGEGRAAVYLTDTSFVSPASQELLRGADPLIIGALRERPHETHFNFRQALSLAAESGVKRCYLTHISHEHSHAAIEAYCRSFMRERGLEGTTMSPAWDTLELEF
jgi:phosphoribosyl 1,2-cyclic phosphate phosphodiesterase